MINIFPALGRQRQADPCIRNPSGLQSELQDSQGYTERPLSWKKTNKQKKNQWFLFDKLQVWNFLASILFCSKY